MPQDPRGAFTERVKTIDPIFKRGDLRAFWPALRGLVRMAPDRADLSRKKSHYLVSLAARSLRRGDARTAAEFLDYADARVNPEHLTPYFVEERRRWRQQVEESLLAAKTGSKESNP